MSRFMNRSTLTAALMLGGTAGAANAAFTYTFDDANSFTTAEGSFDYNPVKPNFRFDFGTPAGVANHSAIFTTVNGNGAVQISQAFNHAANGAGGNAYTIDLFPSPSPTDITNISFKIRVDPTSATDLFGGAGFFQVDTRTDNYTTVGNSFNQELGNPTYNAPTIGTYETISIDLLPTGSNVRAITLRLFNSNDRQINGNVIFQIDDLTLTTVPEPTSMALIAAAVPALLRRCRRAMA